jgi:hypothetical protein
MSFQHLNLVCLQQVSYLNHEYNLSVVTRSGIELLAINELVLAANSFTVAEGAAFGMSFT